MKTFYIYWIIYLYFSFSSTRV